MKTLTIIEAPSNLGLSVPPTDVEPGVRYFSKALLDAGFARKLNIIDVSKVEPGPYSSVIDVETQVRNANAIVDYSNSLSGAIYEKLKENIFTIVLGGDCSILIGTTLALRKSGNHGLFFIDGHTDFVLPEYSETAGAGGMELFVTGHGHPKFSDILNLSPFIKEENVFCFGNREYAEWYVSLIEESHINYYDLHSIRKVGIPKIIDDFLTMVRDRRLDGFWIHLDVDVLNDEIMPCVDSRAKDGLSYDELKTALIPLLSSELARGIQATILDPTLDKDGICIQGFCNAMVECFLAAEVVG